MMKHPTLRQRERNQVLFVSDGRYITECWTKKRNMHKQAFERGHVQPHLDYGAHILLPLDMHQLASGKMTTVAEGGYILACEHQLIAICSCTGTRNGDQCIINCTEWPLIFGKVVKHLYTDANV